MNFRLICKIYITATDSLVIFQLMDCLDKILNDIKNFNFFSKENLEKMIFLKPLFLY